ncbi:MAG: hypothetical protein KYX69_19145 [Sphingomonas sp.]|uniref:hypothetical protein n=1 Tax=Sphingomonas sp. TaxID=28214 RepID=UPI00260AAF25|nr:hypothetical protein [Sphingomonas sp.]MDK2769824.1 hypothetical protein [Sphingomonas sp.]
MTERFPVANRALVFRGLILSHRWWAAALIALALAMKLAVPAGFMPVERAGKIVVMVCTGMGQQRLEIDVPGMPVKQDGATRAAGQPCAFAGLGLDMLSGVDLVLLAAALAFILALGFVGVAVVRVDRGRQLWPPMRGPPLIS